MNARVSCTNASIPHRPSTLGRIELKGGWHAHGITVVKLRPRDAPIDTSLHLDLHAPARNKDLLDYSKSVRNWLPTCGNPVLIDGAVFVFILFAPAPP
jgi:hypothetical protein